MTFRIDYVRNGDVVEIPVEEFERLQATLELLENEALQHVILASVQEYAEDKSRPWDEVREQ